MNNFNKEIAEIAEKFSRIPIFDGIVSKDDYESCNTKILWILKEPNSPDDIEPWDMRDHIKHGLKKDYGIAKGWSYTFKKIVYVTNGILNNIKWCDDLYHPGYKPEVIDELKKIAYINIKKTGGGPTSNNQELIMYYNESKTLLFDQIKQFKPTIIIFGGTYRFFKKDLPLTFKSYGSCNASFGNNILHIDAYHPAHKIKEEIYFNDILAAVNDIDRSN